VARSVALPDVVLLLVLLVPQFVPALDWLSRINPFSPLAALGRRHFDVLTGMGNVSISSGTQTGSVAVNVSSLCLGLAVCLAVQVGLAWRRDVA